MRELSAVRQGLLSVWPTTAPYAVAVTVYTELVLLALWLATVCAAAVPSSTANSASKLSTLAGSGKR